MKAMFAIAMLALCTGALAQDKPAAPKPEAKPEAAKAEKTATERKMPNPRRWHEDARQCLEKASTNEVIKCAEVYL